MNVLKVAAAAAAMMLMGRATLVSAQTAPAAAEPAAASAEPPVLTTVPVESEPAEAAAEPDPDSSARGLGIEEIVVTAQKRSESINTVPIAISAFSGDALKELGVSDTRDLGHIVPGFSYAESGLDNPVYTLRGIGFNDASRTSSSTVGVYADEVGLPYPYMTKGASLDLERVEVLKGPQGTLYGRNTTGGAVNYIANKPQPDFEYGLSADYGSYESGNAEGFVTGPVTDSLNARLAVREAKSGEGWQYSSTRPDDTLGKIDKQAARASVDWRPVDNLRSDFTVDYWRDGSDPQAPQAYALTPLNPAVGAAAVNPQVSSYPLIPRNTDNNRIADWSPQIDWKLDDQFWMGATRNYWDLDNGVSLAFIGAYVDYQTDHSNIPQSGLPVLNSEKTQTTDANSYSLELRASGKALDDQVGWLAGFYNSHDRVKDDQLQYFDTISSLFNTVPGVYPIANRAFIRGKQTANSIAGFGNADWEIDPAFKLTVGARYTKEKRDYSGCIADDPNAQGVLTLAGLFNTLSIAQGGTGGAQRGDCLTIDTQTHNPQAITGTLPEHSLSGKVTLNWTPIEKQLFYASFSRGFKSGSFPILGASNGIQYAPVVQERLDALEIGNKSTFFGGGLQVNSAVFDYEYKDKQLLGSYSDPVFGALPKLYNAPKSRVVGAEIELQVRPTHGLFLSLAGSYLYTDIIKFSGTDRDGNENVDFSGNKLNFTPPVNLVFLANYEHPISQTLNISYGADISYTSKTSSDLQADPLYDIPSYYLLNLRTGVGDPDGRWKLTAWVRNLTDEFYLLATPQLSADVTARYVGMPRTYGLTISYHYF